MAYKDKKGYLRDKYGELIHRKIAYQKYRKNRDKYPLRFSAYDVHHIDEKKTNNSEENLELLERPKHKEVHGIKEVSLAELNKELNKPDPFVVGMYTLLILIALLIVVSIIVGFVMLAT